MNSRERFLGIMNYQPADRMMVWDFYYWPETLERWKKEGLPEDADPAEFLGIDKRWKLLEVKTGPYPVFGEEVIKDEGETVIMLDSWGRRVRVPKSEKKRESTFPQFLEFPIKKRADFEGYCKRLNPTESGRYPNDWPEVVRKHKSRDYPLGLHIDGLFAFCRQMIGLESVSILFYDDPDLIEEMMEYQACFAIEYAKPLLKELDFDFAIFWEDMAYNKGSLISPSLVKKMMLPRYKRITDFLRGHGIDLVWVDSDGTVKELVPIWLEAGINIFFPAEQGTSDNDIRLWRKRFGRSVRIIGGIDKFEVAKGKEAIEIQIKKNIENIREGGFIPLLDHSVPPGVSLDNYRYYLDAIRKIRMD
ncbi:MAG: uroporphyrinogen decarboxylase family protein [Candidatus Omnitrophota bacterium]